MRLLGVVLIQSVYCIIRYLMFAASQLRIRINKGCFTSPRRSLNGFRRKETDCNSRDLWSRDLGYDRNDDAEPFRSIVP